MGFEKSEHFNYLAESVLVRVGNLHRSLTERTVRLTEMVRIILVLVERTFCTCRACSAWNFKRKLRIRVI